MDETTYDTPSTVEKKKRAPPKFTRVVKADFVSMKNRNAELEKLVADQQMKLEKLAMLEQREQAAAEAKVQAEDLKKQKRREADKRRREAKKQAVVGKNE